MSERAATRSGGHLVVDQLVAHGADRIFGVPGESYLTLLDGLYERAERLQLITCRNEGGAAMMAEADAKLTGRPGICVVTRGPGATNASIGVHIAQQDSTPLILLIGQVGRSMLERDAFQEVDFTKMFAPMCKWAAQINDTSRIPEMLARAFSVATSGRPGPVVLALPEDMLSDEVVVDDARRYSTARSAPTPSALARAGEMLLAAERPLAILGGGGWNAAAAKQVASFVRKAGIPVAASFRRQDYFDNTDPMYAGDLGLGMNPRLAERVRTADLLLVLGARLSEVQTNSYTLLNIPNPQQTLIHVHADPEELGRVYQADLPINADPQSMAESLQLLPDLDGGRWQEWARSARADYEVQNTPTQTPGDLQMGGVVDYLRNALPADAIVTNGAGNYTVWVHRFYRYRNFGTQLAPVAGTMGYGIPAAVAAKLRHPDRPVVAFAGDGCFLMNGQEFATAVRHDAHIVCIVVNNGMLGTIRMHQERNYPGRVIGTDLANPDFAAYAQAFGGYGEVVTRTDEFPDAFERASSAGAPAILELRVDPEALTPAQSLSAIRKAALQ